MAVPRRVILALLLLLPVLGCGDDPTIIDRSDRDDAPEAYAEATTPDQLVANLVRAYTERNYPEYDELLHADFRFYLSDGDVAAGTDPVFDRARELEATYKMFSGQPGHKPDGSEQPPVRTITLRLRPGGGWTDNVGQDYQGTLRKRYEVDMTVEFASDRPSSVVGLQEFYAVAVDRDDGDGTTTTIYQLKFWRDLGREGFKGTESASWGSLKAAFSP